jgi:hypothetical protein
MREEAACSSVGVVLCCDEIKTMTREYDTKQAPVAAVGGRPAHPYRDALFVVVC